jgi:NADH dehydrogenase [ubiquinone] 1 alpha subcomplex assembly factor 7
VTPLAGEIAALIASDGPISVARYMDLALSHPRYGYYRTRLPFGAEGDFVTAPDISQMFGELIGLWAADCWARMGEPSCFNLVELGPGRGTLMADALRALRIAPACRAALALHLVETSEALRQRQKETLGQVDGKAGNEAIWHASFEDVPEGPTILIANEFFDALPIRQFLRTAQGWRERLIGLGDDGALAFGIRADIEPSLQLAAPEGALLEICPQGLSLMSEIGRHMAAYGGAALLIDYGHSRRGFGDTLQAVREHRFVDPLAAPGEADLTAHVDFAALGEAARLAGSALHGPTPQGAFLRQLGIEARAARLKAAASPAQAQAVDAALARLTGEGTSEMGTLFKVMAASGPGLSPLAGFET